MRSYGYDETPVRAGSTGDYRPYRGLLIGLFFAFIVSSLAVGAVTYVFVKYLEFEEVEHSFAVIAAQSTNYLVIVLMINTFIMVHAGRAVGLRAFGREGAYGLIFASLVTLVNLFLYDGYDGFALFPAWFNFIVFATTYGAIYFGARSVAPPSV